VLALDLISDFSFPDGPRVRRALKRRGAAIQSLLDAARHHGVSVIYVNDNPGAWRSDSAGLIERCTRPTLAGAALVTALKPRDGDEIVLKPRHSAFFGTPLAALLDDHGVDMLILCGASTESCIWMTACDAYTRGYALVVPEDTMAGAFPRATRAALTGLREVMGARVPEEAASLRFSRGRLR
jgi:nicotinamidase-related amidase